MCQSLGFDPVARTPNMASVGIFRAWPQLGSNVNVVTRSGSNQLHGDLYEFFRNKALNTRGFFDSEKSKFNQNQFGGTLGGPIRHDRCFFSRWRTAKSARAFRPTWSVFHPVRSVPAIFPGPRHSRECCKTIIWPPCSTGGPDARAPSPPVEAHRSARILLGALSSSIIRCRQSASIPLRSIC